MALSKFQRVCAKNIPGCQGLFLAEAANILSVTVTGGEVSALNACMAFKEIEADPHSISWEPGSEKVNKNNQVYKNSLSFAITKPTLSTNTLKSSLADASPAGLMAIVTDGNSQNWLIGYSKEDIKYRPLRLASDIQVTGKTLKDDAGGTIKFILQNSCAGKALPFDSTLNASINDRTALFLEYLVTDYDGNIYNVICIGSQMWLTDNYRVTHYKDGTAIPNLTADANWSTDALGAYCWFDNNIGYKNPYGALYNWYAVNNAHNIVYLKYKGVEDAGWRVPSKTDWQTLETYLGGSTIAGGKLKETGIIHWTSPNVGATNESGFNGMPTGYRVWAGTFMDLHGRMEFWATTEFSPTQGWYIYVMSYFDDTAITADDKKTGFGIRCLKNI